MKYLLLIVTTLALSFCGCDDTTAIEEGWNGTWNVTSSSAGTMPISISVKGSEFTYGGSRFSGTVTSTSAYVTRQQDEYTRLILDFTRNGDTFTGEAEVEITLNGKTTSNSERVTARRK